MPRAVIVTRRPRKDDKIDQIAKKSAKLNGHVINLPDYYLRDARCRCAWKWP